MYSRSKRSTTRCLASRNPPAGAPPPARAAADAQLAQALGQMPRLDHRPLPTSSTARCERRSGARGCCPASRRPGAGASASGRAPLEAPRRAAVAGRGSAGSGAAGPSAARAATAAAPPPRSAGRGSPGASSPPAPAPPGRGWWPPRPARRPARIWVLPTREYSPFSSTRSSLTWSGGAAPPPRRAGACPPRRARTSPALSRTAPVKAPRTWPNSSASSRFSGRAPQLTGMKGLAAAPAVEVDGPGDQLLARAALALDQHRRLRVGDLRDQAAGPRASSGRWPTMASKS